MTNTCAWCEAPKQTGPVCPSCGADYAKAAAIKAHGKASFEEPAASPAFSEPESSPEEHEQLIPVQDPAFEKKACLLALPGMLSFALFVQITGFLSGMQRIFFAMPIHELGHAVSGWLCGFNSIPTLWKTITPENRGYLSSLLVLVLLGWLARYGLKRKQPLWLAFVCLVLIVQGYGTFMISLGKADMVITMGGDAMGMILATLLMMTFYVGKDTQIYKGALRWGFLGIGAAAFINMFAPWWNKDISAIGYGTTGGIPTDSWKMINIHLWEWDALFTVHITLGLLCLTALGIIYGIGLKQAIGWEKLKDKQERLARIREKSN